MNEVPRGISGNSKDAIGLERVYDSHSMFRSSPEAPGISIRKSPTACDKYGGI